MDVDPPASDPSDPDPVVAEYDVFVTPETAEQLYLLQYPTRHREQPYDVAHRAAPLELRMKPNVSFMEVDIGVTPSTNFDKLKGLQWGQALKHARDSGSRGFGLSSGFGKGQEGAQVMVAGGRGGRKKESSEEEMLRNFDVRRERGAVLVKQTLGGQIRTSEEGKPRYMVGTFRGKELHLSQVSGMVQLRPQFHHIDAQSSLTKSNAPRPASTKSTKPAEPRAVVNPARSTENNEDTVANYAQQAERFLQAAADENWTRIRYVDEEDPEAFATFEQTMVLQDAEAAKPLASEWNGRQYLDEIGRLVTEPEVKKKATKKGKEKAEGSRATAGPSRR